MPLARFDSETHNLLHDVLDGCLLILEVAQQDELSPEQKSLIVARINSQLIAAADEGHRDFETLQLMALEGIE